MIYIALLHWDNFPQFCRDRALGKAYRMALDAHVCGKSLPPNWRPYKEMCMQNGDVIKICAHLANQVVGSSIHWVIVSSLFLLISKLRPAMPSAGWDETFHKISKVLGSGNQIEGNGESIAMANVLHVQFGSHKLPFNVLVSLQGVPHQYWIHCNVSSPRFYHVGRAHRNFIKGTCHHGNEHIHQNNDCSPVVHSKYNVANTFCEAALITTKFHCAGIFQSKHSPENCAESILKAGKVHNKCR